MTVTHHPSDDLLGLYASGGLDEGSALLVATHLALCPACRAEAARLEAVGGALIEDLAPAAMADGSLEAVLARLDTAAPDAPGQPPAVVHDERAWRIPQPLRGYLGGRLDTLRWRSIGPQVRYFDVMAPRNGISVRMLRIAPGVALPDHGHTGAEHTLVLEGWFFDETARFARGDVESAGAEDVHAPVAGPDVECICLAVTHAPLKFRGLLNRFAARWIGF
jgi:putative transcriptional regulator